VRLRARNRHFPIPAIPGHAAASLRHRTGMADEFSASVNFLTVGPGAIAIA